MARISPSNARYRDKPTICRDVAVILRADLSYGTKYSVVSEVTWVWSEFNGKLEGCRYWSEAALAASGAPLIHEHVVPKSVIISRLFALSEPTPDAVKDVLEQLCIGVVVTKHENLPRNALGLRSVMPADWCGANPWARYEAAGITVVDLSAGSNNSSKPTPLRGAA